jgi:flagellar protein FlaJ
MAALATGGPERDVILEWTIRQDYKTVSYFRQVYLLSKRLGFEYARAFRLVAGKTKADSVKNLLLRFAGAISSGVSEADFLAEEPRVERDQYINGYYRSLESLAK